MLNVFRTSAVAAAISAAGFAGAAVAADKPGDKPGEKPGEARAAAPIGLELNKVETREGACRAHFVVRNGSDLHFEAFRVDVVFFNKQQIVERRLALNLAPIRPNKTTVLIFSISDIECETLSKALVNDVTECREASGEAKDCVALVAPSSRTSVELIK